MKPALPRVLMPLLLTFALSAHAHTPYLAPASFEPVRGDLVSLDAAFAERFFVPEVVFDNSEPRVIGPDGEQHAPDVVQPLKTRLLIEHRLQQGAGTYRISTGLRLGAVFRTWEVDGERQSSRDPKVQVPAGATGIEHFQSLTRAETYITVKQPDRTALRPYGSGLELVPVTHPSDLYAGERFEFQIQFDGTPLADQKVEFTEATWTSDRSAETVTVLTDAQGRAMLPLTQAGTWLALTRHRAKAPADAAAPEYSHSYTLSFRVLEQ